MGTALAPRDAANAAAVPFNKGSFATASTVEGLPWERNPVNKRSGVTVGEAEKYGYNRSFVTYLTRFLLNFDQDIQKWWFAQSIPKGTDASVLNKLRTEQFGALAASVEVGLQDFEGSKGAKALLAQLLKRYCPPLDTTSINNSNSTSTTSTTLAATDSDTGSKQQQQQLTTRQKRQRREIKEARRQIALLFALLGGDMQPTKEITKVLAAVDNGSVKKSVIPVRKEYGGYEAAPTVLFPPPPAGTEEYETAKGRAIMEPTGRLLRLAITPGTPLVGAAPATPIVYNSEPTVIISPPLNGTVAIGKAILVSKGPRKGQLDRVELTDPGSGYTISDHVRVDIIGEPEQQQLPQTLVDQATPAEAVAAAAATAASAAIVTPLSKRHQTAHPILDLRVSAIEVTATGSGYAAEKPVKVMVASPIAGGDDIVVCTTYPKAEKDSYSTFRKEGDDTKVEDYREEMLERLGETEEEAGGRRVSGTVSGPDSGMPPRPFWGGSSSSSQLLDLLPDGVGLKYDSKLQRYALSVDTEFKESYPGLSQLSSDRPLNPDFGPRGRSPIERDMELGLATYLRFSLSGAICASGVHLALTPLDVVKTKVQTNPSKYPTVGGSFQKVLEEEGLSSFFTGWVPTLLGNFATGALLYALTEFIRRTLTEAAGADALTLEVPIILSAAGIASAVGAFVNCPFEAVKIRSIAQPGYAKDAFGVLGRMVREEGFVSLVNAIPVFLVKNVPYAMAKFTVFDLSTEYMYKAFPAAHDDLKLSLLISLVGGILGGSAAAVVSNPADAVISELKKSKSDMSPQEAATVILDRNGIPGLFKGLPVRLVYYSLLGSVQFLVYDSVRFALGIGSDDLKLYLDVLNGALQESGGPI
uniref:Uncharacterized protein n=2 Tax=Grammatophora oceanica TaxID=210454 RepID=A0A7S1VS03_9STRA|mmetsp:Transcript_5706/g.8060  ORF Transcript_5706/g.8060 Transcript_5706/m.8060 type:complete len:869 (+) Transcript_5706:282-2888(+)